MWSMWLSVGSRPGERSERRRTRPPSRVSGFRRFPQRPFKAYPDRMDVQVGFGPGLRAESFREMGLTVRASPYAGGQRAGDTRGDC